MSNFFRISVIRGRGAKYAACVVLACVAALLMAVPIFGQTVTVTLVGAGDIARCDTSTQDWPYDEQTAQLIGNTLASLSTPAQIITLGDNAYLDGNRANFANCYDNYRLSDYSIYDPSRPVWWGKYKDLTMPSLGNHEYHNSTDPSLQSKPYFDYFSATNGFLAPAAPVPSDSPGLTQGKGYYSYDLGSWHIVVLNSNCDFVSCDGTSAQADWLTKDLASHPAQCTLAYMHHPLYGTGTGGLEPRVKPLWQILYDNGAEVMLTGHNHRYERLARIDPNDDPDSTYGIRPITAGTGGWPGSGTTATNEPNSEVKIFGTAGILRMDLNGPDLNNPNGSYSWQFIAVDGTPNGTVMDSSDAVHGPGGTERCHGAPGNADTTAPAPPVISSPPDNSFNNTGNITVSGTAEANSTVELFDGTISKGSTQAAADGTWSKALAGVAEGSHTYTAKATDAAGNTSTASGARTVIVDTTAPTVDSVTPTDGATGVAVGTKVEATFSEAIDALTVSGSTFTLVKQNADGTTTPVAAAVTYDSATNKATLTPSAPLEAGVTYTATVKGGTGGVKDRAGNALTADKTWRFSTQSTTLSAPSTPGNLTATRSGSSSKQRIDLSWTDSNNETTYVVERSVDNVTWSTLTSTLPANTTTYRDTALQRSTTYYYRVKATNSAGDSPYSDVASVTTR